LKIKIKTALVSVSDKTGLEELVKCLRKHNIKIISTGGTAKFIEELGVSVSDISSVTNFPEMMDGRVKTLHPNVHGGLLAKRDDKNHKKAQEDHGIEDIDLLVVNLYPFEKTMNQQVNDETCVENIDIGGPAMLRSAAKNHQFVTVISNTTEYKNLINELDENKGSTTLEYRKNLAAQTFEITAYYDSLIRNWFYRNHQDFTEYFISAGKLGTKLRYGENPHQYAAVFLSPDNKAGIPYAELVQGKELSYNNINDADAALQIIKEFDPQQEKVVAIIKHANPCGVACGNTLLNAYTKALECDSTSAFGGIVALNQTLDEETTNKITEIFTEVVIAPDVTPDAKKLLSKKTNLRLLIVKDMFNKKKMTSFKSIEGGILFQTNDNKTTTTEDLKIVTKIKPTNAQVEDMLFAFKICKYVKSNAIIYVKNKKTIGIGAGQMSRIDSAKIASQKNSLMTSSNENSLQGSVVASDAFFPFPDGLLVTIESGVNAVIQPGGSINDKDVIQAADEAKVAMVFTGTRHFKH